MLWNMTISQLISFIIRSKVSRYLGFILLDRLTALRDMKKLERKGLRVRDFDAVLRQRILESVVGEAELNAQQLYQSLPVSDQAQMREFYLSKLEGIDVALRHKFRKLYQYY